VARSWLRTRFDRGACAFGTNRKRFRLWISLETGLHGSSSYPTRPVRDVWLPAAHALHEFTGADNVDTDVGHRAPDTDTGHQTPRTGHRTPDARTPDADTGHAPDGRTLDRHRTSDTPTLTEDPDRATKARWASGNLGTTTPLG